MDKKTISLGLLVLSLIAVVLAAFDYIGNVPVLGLGADSWAILAGVVGVWAVFAKTA
jgi:hypothetical protein